VKIFQELVEKTLKEIEMASSDKRKKRGLIIGLLVKLKQVCNHPYQYLKIDITSMDKNEEMKEIVSQSKKLERLLEMTDEVTSNGKKVLIFTQFTQMGVAKLKKKDLGWKPTFLPESRIFIGTMSEPAYRSLDPHILRF